VNLLEVMTIAATGLATFSGLTRYLRLCPYTHVPRLDPARNRASVGDDVVLTFRKSKLNTLAQDVRNPSPRSPFWRPSATVTATSRRHFARKEQICRRNGCG